MTEPIRWIVEPNTGLLPLKFGDTPEMVSDLTELGPPDRVIPTAPEQRTEFRSLAHPTVSYREDRVFHIAVGTHVSNVIFDELDVFQSDVRSVLQAFETANGTQGFVQLGFLVFENLNISAEGFYLEQEDAYFDPSGEEQDDRSLIIHAPGTLETFDDMPKVYLTFF